MQVGLELSTDAHISYCYISVKMMEHPKSSLTADYLSSLVNVRYFCHVSTVILFSYIFWCFHVVLQHRHQGALCRHSIEVVVLAE